MYVRRFDFVIHILRHQGNKQITAVYTIVYTVYSRFGFVKKKIYQRRQSQKKLNIYGWFRRQDHQQQRQRQPQWHHITITITTTINLSLNPPHTAATQHQPTPPSKHQPTPTTTALTTPTYRRYLDLVAATTAVRAAGDGLSFHVAAIGTVLREVPFLPATRARVERASL